MKRKRLDVVFKKQQRPTLKRVLDVCQRFSENSEMTRSFLFRVTGRHTARKRHGIKRLFDKRSLLLIFNLRWLYLALFSHSSAILSHDFINIKWLVSLSLKKSIQYNLRWTLQQLFNKRVNWCYIYYKLFIILQGDH